MSMVCIEPIVPTADLMSFVLRGNVEVRQLQVEVGNG